MAEEIGQFSDAEDDATFPELQRTEASKAISAPEGQESYDENYDEDDDEDDDYCDRDALENFNNLIDGFSHLRIDLAKQYHAATGQISSGMNKQKSSSASKESDNKGSRMKDKNDRATAEQVMDPKTRMILFKLIGRQMVQTINGCVSTGKEANVYHATTSTGADRAIKVFKTSILVFKDRDKYVYGEFRFRHHWAMSKKNPRKMVTAWAEKEIRNLRRIQMANIPCPEPIHQQRNVLLMSFIGENGQAAPKLKDVGLSESKYRESYLQCVHMMRTMFQECRLVHADLSEFNMLYFKDQLYIIDVSQSVEVDNIKSLDFLRNDCRNITNFFRRKEVSTMTIKELFDFVTDSTITDVDEYLEKLMEIASQRTIEDVTDKEKVEEEVFKQVFIPQSLRDVENCERDRKRVEEGVDTDLIFYKTMTGMKDDLSGARQTSLPVEHTEDSSDGEENSEDVSSDEAGHAEDQQKEEGTSVTGGKTLNFVRPRGESPTSKKERKKAVKDVQREKRQEQSHAKRRKEKRQWGHKDKTKN